MNFLTAPTLGACQYPSRLNGTVPDTLGVPAQTRWPDARVPDDLIMFEAAGPRAQLFFDPAHVRAGVVTCGGLCPGLNNVIRSLFLELHYAYGVPEVHGFRWGYRGLDARNGTEPLLLTPELVDDIHKEGGTMLGTSRGPVDLDAALDNLMHRGINVLFCIGGDGTQRGAMALQQRARTRRHQLAVIGIPKTIDNDVKYVTHTFGFLTSVEESRRVIDSAHVEARSVLNGVSLVKLMGREAGFIACSATIASQDVNFCLIPEVPFVLDGAQGLLAALAARLAHRRHAVIVVAEGAGQHLIPGSNGSHDASGNVKLRDIGLFLRDALAAYCAQQNIALTLRYFDPSYQIRSQPADSEDAQLCDRFARNAAHAAMAGKTGVVIGSIGDQFVHVPMDMVVGAQKRVDPGGDLWHAVLASTGQQ